MHPRFLLVALQLLTRLPVGDPWRDRADTARSVAWFPAAGAVVGGLAASTWWLAVLVVPPLAAAVLSLAAVVLLTGALHEDGLADSADGLFGGHDPAGRLAIMRDSRVGTYGLVAVAVVLLLRVSLLAGLAPVQGAAALVAVAVVGRAAAGLGVLGAVPAAPDGRGAALLDHLTTPGPLVGMAAATAAASALLGVAGLAVAATAAATAVAVRVMAVRQLGGLTGDVMGAMIALAEVAGLAMAVAIEAPQ